MRRDYSLSALCGGVALGLIAYRWLIWNELAFAVAIVGLTMMGAMFAHRAQAKARRRRV